MSALAKLVETIFDAKSVLLAAWLLFCGWAYVQSFLGQFGFQASLSDIPLDHYLYYSLRPVVAPIETLDAIGILLLVAIIALIGGVVFVAAKWPAWATVSFAAFVALGFLVGNELAARTAFLDARFLARGCGTTAYVVFDRTKISDLALGAGAMIRANQDRRLMLAWRTGSTLVVVDSDPLAFKPCTQVYREVEQRREVARTDPSSTEVLRASNRRACRDLSGPLLPVSFAIDLNNVEAVIVQDTIGPLVRRFRFLKMGEGHECAV